MCKDLPYESFDNRYLKYDRNIIKVGDSLTISLEGKCDIYNQPFSYNSFYVKPTNYDKNDFAELNNISFIKKHNDGLLIEIENSNYYELINSIDLLARSTNIQFICLNYIDVIHPIWEISNDELAAFTINEDNSITIVALKSGVISIKYDQFKCDITIVSNL